MLAALTLPTSLLGTPLLSLRLPLQFALTPFFRFTFHRDTSCSAGSVWVHSAQSYRRIPFILKSTAFAYGAISVTLLKLHHKGQKARGWEDHNVV
jgi:hypothetical protein